MNTKDVPLGFTPKESFTGDMEINQKPSVESRKDVESEIVVAPHDMSLDMDMQAQLKFNEDPVTIRIESGGAMPGEKFPPQFVSVWCNGKGAEVLIGNRWVEVESLPIRVPLTTKRKYVEILARSKMTSVNTRHEGQEKEQPRNFVDRTTTAHTPFSVLKDENPRGAAWLNGLMYLNG